MVGLIAGPAYRVKNIRNLAREDLLRGQTTKQVIRRLATAGVILARQRRDFSDHVLAKLAAFDERRVGVLGKEALGNYPKAMKLGAQAPEMSVGSASAGPVTLGRSKGKAGSLNQTGLSARITLSSGKTVLYAGDADYDEVRPKSTALPNFIVATHHGANFAGSVIAPVAGTGKCVVSVGKPPHYRGSNS